MGIQVPELLFPVLTVLTVLTPVPRGPCTPGLIGIIIIIIIIIRTEFMCKRQHYNHHHLVATIN